jgi:hypothetical protein
MGLVNNYMVSRIEGIISKELKDDKGITEEGCK